MKIKHPRLFSILIIGLLVASLSPTALAFSAYDCPEQKLVALTFDDGPGDYSDTIMDILDKYDAKATFFMNGYKLKKYSDQVRRMAWEGHQIANHTYNHPYLTKISDGEIQKQVSSTAGLLTEISGLPGTGDTGFYLRPPYGSFSAHVASVAQVPVIWCTVDSEDWRYKDAERLVSHTISLVQDGDIVVMHETRETTAQGLEKLLKELESKGFEMVTVEELLWRRGITPQPGKIYYSAKDTGVNRCARELWFDETELDTHWAWPSIQAVQKKGILTGALEGEFLPNFPLTRGMFVTALGRMSGAEPPKDPDVLYTDVPASHYACSWAAWAAKNDLMEGISEKRFEPDRPITRQEMASVIARYLQFKKIKETGSAAEKYTDQKEIASWATEDVALCSSLGLLEGFDGQFRPDDNATRAMGATVLDRLDCFVTEHSQNAVDEPLLHKLFKKLKNLLSRNH